MTDKVLLRRSPESLTVFQSKDLLPEAAVFFRHNEVTGLDEYILAKEETK